MRVLAPRPTVTTTTAGARIPHTANGVNLKAAYPDRWETFDGGRPAFVAENFGDQIDIVNFDQVRTACRVAMPLLVLVLVPVRLSRGLGSHASAPCK